MWVQFTVYNCGCKAWGDENFPTLCQTQTQTARLGINWLSLRTYDAPMRDLSR